MSYKLFAIITLFISCIFTNTAYADALPKDWDMPDQPNPSDPDYPKTPKNPSTTPPGTIPPPKPSPWDKVRKNIRKIAKPNLPEIGIALGGAAVDWLMDPKNTAPQKAPKCDGSWVYQWSSGQPSTYNPAKASGGFIPYANTYADDMIASQKKYGKSVPPNFRAVGDVREHDGRYYQNIKYDWINGYGHHQVSDATIVQWCLKEDKKDPNEAPKGPDASPPQTQPKPDPNAKPSPSAPPVAPPAPGTDPQPQPQPQPRPDPNKDPETNPRPGADPQAPKGPDASPKPDPKQDPNKDPKPRPDPNKEPEKDPKPRPDPNKEPEKDPNAKPDPNKEPDKEPKPDPKKEPDKEPNKEPEKDPNTKPDPNKEPEAKPFELPAFCSWAAKVCEWIDWTQKPLDEQNTELDIPDPQIPSIDTNINASGSCPNDIVIKGSFAGKQFEFFKFEFSKFCAWLALLKPIVIAMASYGAVKIVGGVNVSD